MPISVEKLRQILVDPGHIEQAAFAKASKEAERKGLSLESVLVDRSLISDSNLGQAIANGFDWHFADLTKMRLPAELLNYLPAVVAKNQRAVIFEKKNDILKLATSNPDNYPFFKLLEKSSGLNVEIYYATPISISEALKTYSQDIEKVADDIIRSFNSGLHPEQSVVKFVDLIMSYAHDNRASDVHIEPDEKKAMVRFRIDGVLHEVLSYPINLHDKIVFRLKIMSKLRTDEHLAPQDGRFSLAIDEGRFDVRLSILPVTGGENIVMRLLTENSRRLSLEDLGFNKEDLVKVRAAAEKPYGMLIAVGPTGSGKTTTLYALLQILNQPDVNIMTIEDPVEYQIDMVRQTQVNPKKNLTFATGLRSLVRQDPDIIMVGEIRDTETAEIAVNIAMTGHLLLSTLHANDAATTFPRLNDMGIEPFLVASSMSVVVAQRLVRKICDKCKVSVTLGEQEKRLLYSSNDLELALKKVSSKKDLNKLTLYKGEGCDACGGTGYAGRTGIFEVLEITDEIRILINQKSSADKIYEAARKAGMANMLEDGFRKVLAGVTTIDEVVRTTKV